MSADSSPPSDDEYSTTIKEEQPSDSTVADTTADNTATRDPSATMDPRDVTVSIADEATVEAKSVAMEIDAAFQADPSGFAMSFEELSAENQSEQLYDDLTAVAESEATDNQLAHDNQVSSLMPTITQNAEVSAQSAPTKDADPIKQERMPSPASIEPKPTKEQPPVATRKSPRRTAETKATTTKKTGGGTKRASAATTAPATQAFSWNDILRVQNLIERCLQRYLSKNEIVMSLKAQANVDPSFTAVVWQKLEEQNPTFFKAYNLQLKLKDQITAYNYLVSQQKEMMAKASGSAAFMSFLSSTESRNAQRQGLATNSRVSRLTTTAQARARSSGFPTSSSSFSTTTTGSSMGFTTTGSSHGFPPPSPLPLPSPIKTDLDTHAFFS